MAIASDPGADPEVQPPHLSVTEFLFYFNTIHIFRCQPLSTIQFRNIVHRLTRQCAKHKRNQWIDHRFTTRRRTGRRHYFRRRGENYRTFSIPCDENFCRRKFLPQAVGCPRPWAMAQTTKFLVADDIARNNCSVCDSLYNCYLAPVGKSFRNILNFIRKILNPRRSLCEDGTDNRRCKSIK